MTHHAPHEQEIRAAAAHFGRRRFLTATGAAAALAFATNLPGTGAAYAAEADARKITENPFTLGVASGDPQSGSVVLWTRLAPRPYEPGNGMPDARVTVRWEVAYDEHFKRLALPGPRRRPRGVQPLRAHRAHRSRARPRLLLPLPRRRAGSARSAAPAPHPPRAPGSPT